MRYVSALRNSRFWKVLVRIQEIILFSLSIGVLAVLGLVVLMRYVFHTDVFAFDEIVLVIAYWMYFLGSGYALYEGTHVKADVLEAFVPRRIKLALRSLVGLIQVVLGIIYIGWAWEMIVYSWTEMPKTIVWEIPIAFPQTSVFIGFILMTFYSLVYCLEDFFSFLEEGKKGCSQVPVEGLTETETSRADAEKPILAAVEPNVAAAMHAREE